MTSPHEPSGYAIGGRYRLEQRIARGGMGEVWRAVDEVLNRPVAVKVLRPEYADEEVFLERFRSEARNTAALTHTGVAQVYDFGQAVAGGANVPFIVMELVPGEPLSHLIEREGSLGLDRSLDLVAQAARALQAAHVAGIIHRDIKPANLLITPNWAVKVTDFGIARAGDALPLTRGGTVMGTAHYLAPELISTKGGAAPASDIYALGVVLYECLAGRRPFAGDNPLAVAMAHLHNEPPPIPGLPPSVAALVAAVLAKEPAGRPRSAAELAHRLVTLRIDLAAAETPEVVARSLGPEADPAAVRTAAARWRRRGPGRAEGPAGPGRHRTPPSRESAPTHGRRRRPARSPARRPAVLGAVATAMVFGLAGLWLADSDDASVVVPAVAGVVEHDADKAIKASGLSVKVLREVSDTVPAGVVLSQSPQAGTRTGSRGAVEILVSSGPPAVLVDPADWVGLPPPEARAGLEARGLVVQEQQVSGLGPPGTVADVTPHGPVPVGETVVVSVVAPAPPGEGATALGGSAPAGSGSGTSGKAVQ